MPPFNQQAEELVTKDGSTMTIEAANTRDADGFLPIHHACSSNEADVVDSLLSRYQSPYSECVPMISAVLSFSIDAEEPHSGVTLMHWAANFGHADVLEVLIRHGGDVRAVDSHGGTPLLYACLRYAIGSVIGVEGEKKAGECVKMLLANGADVNAMHIYSTPPYLHIPSTATPEF